MQASAWSGSLNATDATPSGCLCQTKHITNVQSRSCDFKSTAVTLRNSHQRGWLFWPLQTFHTPFSDLHDIRSTPVGLPADGPHRDRYRGPNRWTEEGVDWNTSKSLGWNMFLMMMTFSFLFLASPCFSGLQSNCLQIPRHNQKLHHRNTNRKWHFLKRKKKEGEFTFVAAAASSCNPCSSSSSCWRRTDPSAQNVQLPRGPCDLWPLTRQSVGEPKPLTLSAGKHTPMASVSKVLNPEIVTEGSQYTTCWGRQSASAEVWKEFIQRLDFHRLVLDVNV